MTNITDENLDAVENTEAAEVSNDTATETIETEAIQPTAKQRKKKPIIPKDIDDSQYVTVYNGFQGTLVYRSSRSGERFVWDDFGDEQEMELRELKNAKNSAKKFFINNWFMFKEDWIVDYLGIGQYYKHAISIDHFDDIFDMKTADLKKAVSELSNGQKKSVAYRAKELIAEKKLDSLSKIEALEEALNIELIEK